MEEYKKQELAGQIARQVMEQLNGNRWTLDTAKKIMEAVERRSAEQGLCSVVAVCGADGNMIAVHRMEGAYLVSFDVAMKKAYTAVAVQMSTRELGELAQPGEMFYGVDKADQGRIIIIGGGVPVYYNGQLAGAVGVSGGTAQEDHELAEYGRKIAEDILYGRV